MAAEQALRDHLRSRGLDDEEIDDVVEKIHSDPTKFQARLDKPLHAAFACFLLEAGQRAIVPFNPAAGPPMPVRAPTITDVDGDKLETDRFFKPLGPVVKPDAPEQHYYSHLRIDHTVSGFVVGSEEEKAVLRIYEHLMYESKPNPPCKEVPNSHRPGPDCTRGPFFTVREHDLKPPVSGSHKEILIFGSTQLSKTPEACSTAWCAYFIDGCVPILCVRNKGGANTGSSDMASGIDKLNERIRELFEHEVRSKYINLPETDASKFLLVPRCSSGSSGESIEFDKFTMRLARPQVLVMCMNVSQVKNLIGNSTKKTAKAGAQSGLFDIMKGNTHHPYPPKCHDPYAPFDDGANRKLSRLYFILDEDDLNRSNNSSVTERLQFDAPPEVKRRLEAGLKKRSTSPSAAGASTSVVELDGSDDEHAESDDDTGDDGAAAKEAADRAAFKHEMTGVRSAVRGVVALTATPAACGHDIQKNASQVKHHICVMEHPTNYVGYEFTAAAYAERKIVHEPVPDRKQIIAIKKGILYEKVLKEHGWWNTEADEPMLPFKMRADGAIMVTKKALAESGDVVEAGEKSANELKQIVDEAQKESGRRGHKVLESDGVGIAMMLQSMAERPEEPERRALIVSNYTKNAAQKMQLAKHILLGDLKLEDGSALPGSCLCDLFIIIFDHKLLRIMWRGTQTDSEDVVIAPDHDSFHVLAAIRGASPELYGGCRTGTFAREVCIEDYESPAVKMFCTTFININHAYTALHLYARNRRMHGHTAFKLKTIALAGDLGGRGVNYKPHGCGHDPTRGTWIVQPHQGYLSDMFFMFDATKNRQITTHGEYILQAIGRLCTLTRDETLALMEATPPRLWTSLSCYHVITTFAKGVDQWVKAMQGKKPGESIYEAVVRKIKADPDEFCELYMIYGVPSTDPKWAKKELFLRQSRLFGARFDKAGRDIILAAPHMPRTPAAERFGIEHNPDRDTAERAGQAIATAKRRQEQGELDSDDSNDSNGSPAAVDASARKSQRLSRLHAAAPSNAEQMREKFASLYSNNPSKAKTTTGLAMPKFHQKIWTQWNDGDPKYYSVRVFDIEYEDGNFRYELEWQTNDDGSRVGDGASKHADSTILDPAMSDWSYEDPSIVGGPSGS